MVQSLGNPHRLVYPHTAGLTSVAVSGWTPTKADAERIWSEVGGLAKDAKADRDA